MHARFSVNPDQVTLTANKIKKKIFKHYYRKLIIYERPVFLHHWDAS